MAWFDYGSAGGATPGGGAFGTNPQVPLPTTTAQQTVTGDIGNLGNLYALAAPTNQFNIQQAQQPLIQGLPNYTGMVGQSSQNISSLLRGEVPGDVVNQIVQQAAERGIATGAPGSPNANTALLSALGQTSLGLQSQGESELSAAIARTPQAPLFNPAQFFVTPEQQQQAAAANALYAAAPNPLKAAQANLGALQTGLGMGRNAVGEPSSLPLPFQQAQGPGTIVGQSTATDILSGGMPMAPPGSQPFDWYSSIMPTSMLGTEPGNQVGDVMNSLLGVNPYDILGQQPGVQDWTSTDLGANDPLSFAANLGGDVGDLGGP